VEVRQATQDREVVARAASENEEVPDCMVVRDALPGIENYARGVEQTASEKPEHRYCWDMREHRLGGNDDQPAHGDVHCRGEKREVVDKPKFENDPC